MGCFASIAMTIPIRFGRQSGDFAKAGGWTKTRPVSLGLLPSGPDPVGERYVLRQPPGAYVDYGSPGSKGAEASMRGRAVLTPRRRRHGDFAAIRERAKGSHPTIELSNDSSETE